MNMWKWVLIFLAVVSALDIKYEGAVNCPKKPCYEYYKATVKQYLQRK